MGIVIEAYHLSRAGEPVDLIDENTGDVIFPFSNGSILQAYINTDEKLPERDMIADENNTESFKYTSFLKLNEWEVIGGVLPDHVMALLYLLKTVSNTYFIMNNKKVRFYDILINEPDKDFGVVGVEIQLLTQETSITGNY